VKALLAISSPMISLVYCEGVRRIRKDRRQ
jgi:hypothetical protein